jgi:hypothetical protein
MFSNKTHTITSEEKQLMEAVKNAKIEYIEAIKGFEEVTDQLLVDYYIYKIQACQSRYQFYLQKVKEHGLKGLDESMLIHQGSNHAS